MRDHGIVMEPVTQSRATLGPLGTKFYRAIRERRIVLYDDPYLRDAHHAAVIEEVPEGYVFKKGGRDKIDFIITAVMAVPSLLDFSQALPAGELWERSLDLQRRSRWGQSRDYALSTDDGWVVRSDGVSHWSSGRGRRPWRR